jgi:GDSL-like Lipase/Acylhydrolase
MSSTRVTVISPDELEGNGQISTPGVFYSWQDYDRHYLAEGDSWFSLSDLLSPSFLYRFGNHVPLRHSTLIVNCSYPGDTLANMVEWSKNPDFPRLLAKQNFGWEWDGVLLSAGGNDLINAALSPAGILRERANPASFQDFIVDDAITMLENHLREYFRYFAGLRDTSAITANRTIPIFYHTYGYPTARNAPASVAGPWLYRAYMQKHIPGQYWDALTHTLMNRLAKILRGFSELGSNLQLVDTLENVELKPAIENSTGSSGDWLNEIHLNNAGKDKVARYWAKFI